MRISDGHKRAIYESCFTPDRVYTIEEAYAFIEQFAPVIVDDAAACTPDGLKAAVAAVKAFQAQVDARFPRVSLREAAGLDVTDMWIDDLIDEVQAGLAAIEPDE
jgi:hypothetical protein